MRETGRGLLAAELAALAVISSVIFAGAVVLGVVQYRNVMSPLNRLRAGVRKIAAGQFKQRLQEHGTAEFAELADEFNKMAAELDEFYHRLEEKVNQKSRELIRSERMPWGARWPQPAAKDAHLPTGQGRQSESGGAGIFQTADEDAADRWHRESDGR